MFGKTQRNFGKLVETLRWKTSDDALQNMKQFLELAMVLKFRRRVTLMRDVPSLFGI